MEIKCKELGQPTTIGCLKEMIKHYPDKTPFVFRNQPEQILNETRYGKEVFVSFQEK